MNRVEKIKAMLEEVDYEEIFLEREKRESAYVKGLRNKSITKKDILILNSEYEFAKIIEDAYGILLNAKQIDREIDTE
ncbi:MAG: hypothetical protein PHY53_04305 [Methanobacterium formicicum]|nr:hypothetical protein [Methanobacterium formicicum]